MAEKTLPSPSPHCQPIYSELSSHTSLRAVGHPDYRFLFIKKNVSANAFHSLQELAEEPEALERMASVFILELSIVCYSENNQRINGCVHSLKLQ